ncbi:c-type cytochrome [Ralstonia syzygii]|uniref:Cytrochrome C oxidoreductase subunit B n=1 Tax=Ralstonia syzygii R24 TaxID=907261 RepID=G3A5G5_9RALS|nr:cytochrome c [Ralstonia syzygii]CCA89197.1 cytrochrome C oxidoreductase subunit B [Ralstonia syzygii R24]
MSDRKTPLGGIVRAALACAAAWAAAPAWALDVTLPPETAQYRPSDLPGYRLVLQHCMICHAAQYVQMQPPTLPRSYWEATVKKMKVPFGAPFPEEDMPAMVDYLVKTYGAERSGATAPAQGARPTAP